MLWVEEQNKIQFPLFLWLSSLSQTARKPCDRPNRKASLHLFQVLGWASFSGNIPPNRSVCWPNKRCHIACPVPSFLRANMATNVSCCHVTSNCHPAQLRNANHCKPKVLTCHSPDIPGSKWHGHLHSCLLPPLPQFAAEGKKIDIYLVYSPPSNPPFILQLGWTWSLSEALWLLTELSKLQRE